MSAVIAAIEGQSPETIARKLAEAHTQAVNRAVFNAELEALGAVYSRVDLIINERIWRHVTTYKYGESPSRVCAMTCHPVPIAVVTHPDDLKSVEWTPPMASYFFNNDEDAVLFKLKYEGVKSPAVES